MENHHLSVNNLNVPCITRSPKYAKSTALHFPKIEEGEHRRKGHTLFVISEVVEEARKEIKPMT